MTDQKVPGRLRTRPQQASYSQKNNEEEKIMPIRVQKQIKSEERPLLDVGEFESVEKMQQSILEHYRGLSLKKEKKMTIIIKFYGLRSTADYNARLNYCAHSLSSFS